MPSLRRKHSTLMSSAGAESKDATRMTTECIYEEKQTLARNASPKHQVEPPAKRVPPVDEESRLPPDPTPSHNIDDHSLISSPVSCQKPLTNGVIQSPRRLSRQNALSIPDANDTETGLALQKNPSKNEKLTLYFYRRGRSNVPPSDVLNKISSHQASKSIDVSSMNGVRKHNGALEGKSSDSDTYFEANDPIVPHGIKLVETAKSPDSQSVDTFLSAKSDWSDDELENCVEDEIGGGGDHANSKDDVDGLIEAEPSTSVCLSPNDSSTSSTLSPGSSTAPEVVIVPPSSSSSSHTVSSAGLLAVRPCTLGAIPKVKMVSLSPSYLPRDKKEVSMEAMKVLDTLLKRSYSQNDASPLLHRYQAVAEMERIEESTDPDDSAKKTVDGDAESLPEYDGCHSPVSKSNSIYSSSSQSSSFKHKIVPLTKKDVDDALQKNQHRKKHLVKKRRKSDSSSSTSTDEELQQERQVRRKRKSLFKKAKDKLRKSLKHRRESSLGGTKRSSDKSSSTQSPGTEVVGEIHTHFDRHVHTEVHPDPTRPDGSIVLRTETIHTSRDETYPKKSGKHVETTVHLKESFPIKEKKDSKGILDSLIQYIRSGKAKLKKKSPKRHLARSKSAEEIPQHTDDGSLLVDNTYTSWSLEKGGSRRVTHECHTQIGEELEEDSADGPSRNFRLDGLLRYRPAISVEEEKDETRLIVSGPSGSHEVPYEVHESRHTLPSDVLADGLDDVDFHSPSVADKPHLQRTHSEREQIYEKVADQLAAIADNYDITSPLSPERKKQMAACAVEKESQDPIVLPGSMESSVDHENKKELASYLRDKGDKMAEEMPQLNPIVKDLVKNVSYTHFHTVLHEQMRGDNNIQQIALFFKVIKQAVQTVGYGTAMAMQLKEMSLRYFEDQYADWVIGQGGWESIAEETDLSSEVD